MTDLERSSNVTIQDVQKHSISTSKTRRRRQQNDKTGRDSSPAGKAHTQHGLVKFCLKLVLGEI